MATSAARRSCAGPRAGRLFTRACALGGLCTDDARQRTPASCRYLQAAGHRARIPHIKFMGDLVFIWYCTNLVFWRVNTSSARTPEYPHSGTRRIGAGWGLIPPPGAPQAYAPCAQRTTCAATGACRALVAPGLTNGARRGRPAAAARARMVAAPATSWSGRVSFSSSPSRSSPLPLSFPAAPRPPTHPLLHVPCT